MNTFDSSTHPQATQSHDTLNPPNLLSFMLTGWKQPTKKPPLKLERAESFQKRRRILSEKFPGEYLFIASGHYKVRSNDDLYRFRPGTDFYYLTGNQEPDCVLIMIPQSMGGHRDLLFVEPNPGKSDPTFFTDRVKGELWVGARLGVEESKARYKVDECMPLPQLESFIKSQAKGKLRVLRGFSDPLEKTLSEHWGEHRIRLPEQVAADRGFGETLSEMRLIKDKNEIEELAAVCKATQRGFEDVIRRLKTAKTERELEGVFYTRARIEGNDVGYGTIVASGAHACTLHWSRNTGTLKKGDLLLLDGGIEGNALYTADITRTLPIKGKFTREQVQIYDLVHAAQAAAFRAVKPGNDFMDPNRAAMRVLAKGLEKLKILQTSAEEALLDQNQFYKRYSLHNVSHMLGIDVHDCAQARQECYKYGKLQVGMVLTVEPGLYFQLDDLTVPAKYRGIGVRIEDDVVVTATGCRNLSGKMPSRSGDVERWIKKLWSAK